MTLGEIIRLLVMVDTYTPDIRGTVAKSCLHQAIEELDKLSPCMAGRSTGGTLVVTGS